MLTDEKERNFKIIEINQKFYIEYETYCKPFDRWTVSIFKDFLGESLVFYNKRDAQLFIKTRKEINKIYKTSY